MGDIVKHNQPCIGDDCTSTDAMQVYADGTGFCFSCNEFFKASEIESGETSPAQLKVPEKKTTDNKLTVEDVLKYPIRGFLDRAIPQDICEFFGVRASYGSNGEIHTHYYPHGNGYNCRIAPTKQFFRVGEFNKLFGQDKFSGGGRRLVITEGELDALTVAYATKEKFNKIYPVVSMGSVANIKMLIEQREWIRSFNEVVLWFDNDEAGKKALAEAIRIVGYDKAKIAKHPTFKDANEIIQTKTFTAWPEVYQTILDAETFIPSGIINKDALWQQLVEYNAKESLPFPECLGGLNTKLKGKREGEITLFTSGTGSGKSTIFREDMLFTLANTPADVKIGVLSLEEAPAETARKLAGMFLNRNPSDEEISIEDLKPGFDAVFGTDRVVLLDHQGAITDNSIIDQLEYMCLVGCKYIYIDHITILVSEGVASLVGNEAQDKMMGDLLRLVKRHPVWIGLISHLRKVNTGSTSFEEGKLPSLDDIRGSGSIKQISFDIVGFARNLMAEDEIDRNTIKMAVLKARYTGLTGEVTGAVYNQKTGRLTAANDADKLQQESFRKVEVVDEGTGEIIDAVLNTRSGKLAPAPYKPLNTPSLAATWRPKNNS
jgi:twinkle protein